MSDIILMIAGLGGATVALVHGIPWADDRIAVNERRNAVSAPRELGSIST